MCIKPLLICNHVAIIITCLPCWLAGCEQPSQSAGQIEHTCPEYAIFKLPLAKYDIIATKIRILSSEQTHSHFIVANIVSAHAFSVFWWHYDTC
uniref:Secreted protein n=1 Tax=Rhipicephalus appendiculatus TaxID=34631 RepID=A0A131YAH6_RHIAP